MTDSEFEGPGCNHYECQIYPFCLQSRGFTHIKREILLADDDGNVRVTDTLRAARPLQKISINLSFKDDETKDE